MPNPDLESAHVDRAISAIEDLQRQNRPKEVVQKARTAEEIMAERMREHDAAWREKRAAAQDAQAKASAKAAAETINKARALTFKAAYVSDDGVIFAIAATAGTVDLDDDVLQTPALVKMAYDFTSSAKRTFKANHSEEVEADLVASMVGAPILKSGRVLDYGEAIPIDDAMVGISLTGHPSAWVVGIRPKDRSIAELAKAGGIAGLSWGAYAQRSPMKE